MPARASWKGFLQVSQLSVPVKAFTAVVQGPEVELNQLHRDCGRRIQQQKVCPVHGVLGHDDIISGFEYSQGQYLPIEPADLEALRPEDHKAIGVDCFVPNSLIDSVYHSGRTYYLVPDGPPGQRPFCVLRDGMQAAGRYAMAQVVIGNSKQLVLLRPLKRVVAMTVLEYPQRIRPDCDYESEVSGMVSSETEQRLIGQLIDSLTESDLDISRYRDDYTDRVAQLVQQRISTFEPTVINVGQAESEDADLVAALMASLPPVSPIDRISASVTRNNSHAENSSHGMETTLERKFG